VIQALDYRQLREQMVAGQIAARGIASPRVLAAMRTVRREGYVPSYLGEFAYEDTPLAIEEEQTISQPYMVAFMVEALALQGGERVLEIGTGSGYAAAVLAEVAGEVFTIERHERLAAKARERLQRDGYLKVHVRHGDGTLGWPEQAPFDAIVVAAGGPEVPAALRQQLTVGGRLVIPVGPTPGLQKLVRVTRESLTKFRSEELADVRFVPLVGAAGWHEPAGNAPSRPKGAPAARPTGLAALVREAAEPFPTLQEATLGPLLDRIGSARVVLIGEATHGTAEFYRMRARITRELVQDRGFTIVAIEGDWPDAARIDRHVRDRAASQPEWQACGRFPAWMWRNREVREFVEWLRNHNLARPPRQRVRFAGLDLYSMSESMAAVLRYLDETDPASAEVARHRYGCLTPWQRDPAAYGRAALTQRYHSCEGEVLRALADLLHKRLEYAQRGDEAFFDAAQNARLVAEAESYYRLLYYGAKESWNRRDRHMFTSLGHLLDFHGPDAKAVVWAHNSHVGDATATEMAARGEWNIGQLCRQHWGEAAYLIGFGTDHGTVAAAAHWDGPMQVMHVRPALAGSYERLMLETQKPSFLLPLRHPNRDELCPALRASRLQRAIGVVYRPETERASHWFHATLPRQFDEYIWFARTSAVHPLATRETAEAPDTFPFGV
jgi:protein-L-isoaspartate(D-aspartate) O-methyltransferase